MDIKRLLHTLKHLKPEQFYYRIYYLIRKKTSPITLGLKAYNKVTDIKHKHGIPLFPLMSCDPKLSVSAEDNLAFTFINLNKEFPSFDDIDWEYKEHGMLWLYNMHYLAYLHSLPKAQGEKYLKSYLGRLPQMDVALDPYPTSLRIINIIKYCINHNISDEAISSSLYNQAILVTQKLEYHLLANHLLENAIGLMFAGVYLEEETILKKAEKLLIRELNEEVLEDGMHYERSPMYHVILLQRLLELNLLIQWCTTKHRTDTGLLLKGIVSKMIDCAYALYCGNDLLPMFGDSAHGIAPSKLDLEALANKNGITPKVSTLKESGYRKLHTNDMQAIVNIGEIGPSYQPGHAHADTFSFELYYKGSPFIVDMGISTYNTCGRRMLERSTESHNTLTVDRNNSSDVWGSFRVGKRAKVKVTDDTPHTVGASHNGFHNLGVVHHRTFRLEESSFFLIDKAVTKNPNKNSKQKLELHLHFSPEVKPNASSQNELHFDSLELYVKLEGIIALVIEEYDYPLGYNNFTKAKKAILTIPFDTECMTKFVSKI